MLSVSIQKFAGEGLRTLALAERYIDENFFYEWRKRQQEAATSLSSREDRLGEIYEEIECEMSLIGVTAIEDKLQVRCISFIRKVIECETNLNAQ